jgi:uncharacterized protein YdeI (YjbR/CyaY-like superfamily)
VVHSVPADLRLVLIGEAPLLDAWESLTPLARNEWLCWIESAKKSETRARRLTITREQLLAGKRRPCCWPGCPHRPEKTAGSRQQDSNQ